MQQKIARPGLVAQTICKAEEPFQQARCRFRPRWPGRRERGPRSHRFADGDADFEEVGERALFDRVAYADKKAAQDTCRKEKDWSAPYAKAEVPPVPPVPGVESRTHHRHAGDSDGLDLTIFRGTVLAHLRLEGGGCSLDPATARARAQLFVPGS